MADPSGIVGLTAGASHLAWRLYKKCARCAALQRGSGLIVVAGRDCVGECKDLEEVTDLLAKTLREVNDLMEDDDLMDLKKTGFIGCIKACNNLLVDLRKHLSKFESLTTEERRLPERIRWDQDQASRLKSRITQNVQMLQISLHRFNTCQQKEIVRLLKDLLKQTQNGYGKAASVSEFVAAEEPNEDQAWPSIVRDLREWGVEEGAANQNRDLIISILREARVEGLTSDAGSVAPPSRHLELERDRQTETTGTHMDDVFSRDGRSTAHHRDSRTSYDTMSIAASDMHMHANSSKYLAIFDPIASDIKAKVMRESNSLRDDINRARKYWVSKDWANCKIQLIRLLVASELPVHRRSDLSPKLITFLLGVACTWSGDLETARLVFTCLVMDGSPEAARSTSPVPSSGITQLNLDAPLDDSGVAAATWLGDVCLMTDRTVDAAFAYFIALDSINRRTRGNRLPNSSTADLHELNQFHALPRPVPKLTMRQTHPNILASELDVGNRRIKHLDELIDSLGAGDFAASNSIFEDIELTPSPLTIVQNALPTFESVKTLPSFRTLEKEPTISSVLGLDFAHGQAVHQRFTNSDRINIPIVSAEERLDIRTSKAEWPLLWNPHFSLPTAMHVLEWFYNETPVPEQSLFSNPKALERPSAERGKPDHLVGKDNKDSLASQIRRWLKTARIDYKEFPGEFRCRPNSEHANKWPDVAVFRIVVMQVKGEGMLKKTKLGATLCDFVFWDGTVLTRPVAQGDHADVLQQAFLAYVKSDQVEVRANNRCELRFFPQYTQFHSLQVRTAYQLDEYSRRLNRAQSSAFYATA